MEHSALHAVQLLGLIIVVGCPCYVLGVLDPACRAHAQEGRGWAPTSGFFDDASRRAAFAALAAALAGLADICVQVAELQGTTIFGGVNAGLLVRFATETRSGQMALLRAGALVTFVTISVLPIAGILRRWLMVFVAVVIVICSGLVGHAAARPTGRFVAVFVQVLHVGGAALWLGVLVHLLGCCRRGSGEPNAFDLIADMVRRFSPIALVAVIAVLTSGVYTVCGYIHTGAALLSSPYGLTLVIKLILLAVALGAGLGNYAIIRPALLRQTRLSSSPSIDVSQRHSLLCRFNRWLELEVSAGLVAVTVAGVLGSVAPPLGPGQQQLTTEHAQALLRMHLPRFKPVNPETFYGAPERVLEDMLYSEFMHNWSGIAVTVLGACWLAQSLGGRSGAWSAQVWPWLLLVFGMFLAVASDPEVWLLRRVTVFQVLSDPQIMEHLAGAVIVLVIAGVAYAEHRRPPEFRPLGYILPVIMVCGGFLLLGHAHSSVSSSSDLTSLINVQHAVLGGFGLFAGVVRWWTLRGLIPVRYSRWVWPSLVIALGLFLTFFYRETV